MNNEGLIIICEDTILCLNLLFLDTSKGQCWSMKVRYLDTGCREDVFHQVLVDPGVPLQSLAADSNHLWPLQQAHLQLKRHGYLPKVAPGLTLQCIPKKKAKRATETWGLDQRLGSRIRNDDVSSSYPFCVKSMFFSGRMERIWFRTWSGLVSLVRVTLYCA